MNKAGLNELCAEQLGWHWEIIGDKWELIDPSGQTPIDCFNPCDDWNDMQLLINEIKHDRFSIREKFARELQALMSSEQFKKDIITVANFWMIFGSAVCKAFLKAKGVEIE